VEIEVPMMIDRPTHGDDFDDDDLDDDADWEDDTDGPEVIWVSH
jgi:hypothetical protein